MATACAPKARADLVAIHGDAVLTLSLDVTDRDAVFASVGDAHRYFGRPDVILCNAGYGNLSAVEQII